MFPWAQPAPDSAASDGPAAASGSSPSAKRRTGRSGGANLPAARRRRTATSTWRWASSWAKKAGAGAPVPPPPNLSTQPHSHGKVPENDDGFMVRLGTQAGFRGRWYCGRILDPSDVPGAADQCGPEGGPQCHACARFQINYEPDLNDDGYPVKRSTSVKSCYLFYCGRPGVVAGTGGQCGPQEGPQCPSCQRLQESFKASHVNDEGCQVLRGTGESYRGTYYCGRVLGVRAIPGSDGRCGPADGPQCNSCKRFQVSQQIVIDDDPPRVPRTPRVENRISGSTPEPTIKQEVEIERAKPKAKQKPKAKPKAGRKPTRTPVTPVTPVTPLSPTPGTPRKVKEELESPAPRRPRTSKTRGPTPSPSPSSHTPSPSSAASPRSPRSPELPGSPQPASRGSGSGAGPRRVAPHTSPVVMSPRDPTYETLCSECGKADRPAELLLCDLMAPGCHIATHLRCCRPALKAIPQGDWYCTACRAAAATAAVPLVLCSECGSGERPAHLLLCDAMGPGCKIATHLECCQPPLAQVPQEDWFCVQCAPAKVKGTGKGGVAASFRSLGDALKVAAAQLAYLKPFQIASIATAAAHFRLRDPKLLVRLGQSVGSNLDAFSTEQVASVAEAFDVVGHHHKSLAGYIEKILLKDSLSPAEFPDRSRPRLLAAFLIAAAQQEHFARRSRQSLERFAEELTALLRSFEVPPKELVSDRPSSSRAKIRSLIDAMKQAPKPPQPTGSRRPVRRRGRRRPQEAEPQDAELKASESQAPKDRSQADLSMQFAAEQLADLEAIAASLGGKEPKEEKEEAVAPPAAQLGGEMVPGVGFVAGRVRRINGTALEVAAFAPTGSRVVRQRVHASTRHFNPFLGGRHPANLRILRRLKRLERELQLDGATSMPFTEMLRRKRKWYAQPGDVGQKAYRRYADLRAQQSLLWRTLRRYRLGGFDPELARGRFVTASSSTPIALHQASVLSLDQSVVLARALQASELPGSKELLQELGEHSAKAAECCVTPLEKQRALLALSRVTSALAEAKLGSVRLLMALEVQMLRAEVGETRSVRPRAWPRALLAYLRMAKICGGDKDSHARTASAQLAQLLQIGADGRALLWNLSCEDLASFVTALAELLGDAQLLAPRSRFRLRRGLLAGLGSLDAELTGAPLPKGWQRPLETSRGAPPPSSALLPLASATLWLSREGSTQVCAKLGIPAQKVKDLAYAWSGVRYR
ncbi:unnamed protein product [Effrenium voratum]|uniref:PHD-type domain-containing protein n=1 Tax=Effrenium voratum TaxID=2562239 RepID=A0AA36HXT3_9DINO|nr:unnamed protein product [Effrenium voratum]